MIKYDIQGLKEKCMNNRGQFKEGELFERIGADSISYIGNHKYSLSFYNSFREQGAKRSYSYSYDIILSQDGVEFNFFRANPKCKTVEFACIAVNEASAKLLEILKELENYKFEPVGYTLWSDYPSTPFFEKQKNLLEQR